MKQDFAEWEFEYFDSATQLLKLIEQTTAPTLVIFEWDPKCEDFSEIASGMQERQAFESISMLLVCTSNERAGLYKYMGHGIEDILTFPLDEEFFLKKIQAHSKNLEDRQALLDSSRVLERYAQHIDQIAIERARQLIHAERLSILGMMSAGIAHEMKTPLAYIGSSLEAASIYFEQINEKVKLQSNDNHLGLQEPALKILQAFERMDHGLERINALTGGLKKFARESEGSRRSWSINELVTQALEICESSFRYSVNLERELSSKAPLIVADGQQIEQVIINLIVNACDALEGKEQPAIVIRTGESDGVVFVRVEDNGDGIPEESLEMIWKSFYTTKDSDRGTGLGLAISQSIIREHHGSITAFNLPTGGACFEFKIPKTSSTGSNQLESSQQPAVE